MPAVVSANQDRRRCYVCGGVVPKAEGIDHADLRILTHDDPCAVAVAEERRSYDRSPRGRWRPAGEVRARLRGGNPAPRPGGDAAVTPNMKRRSRRLSLGSWPCRSGNSVDAFLHVGESGGIGQLDLEWASPPPFADRRDHEDYVSTIFPAILSKVREATEQLGPVLVIRS